MIARCLKSAAVVMALLLMALLPHRTCAQVLTFDVASMHQNRSGLPPVGDLPESNVPLGPGNVYTPTGGLLTVRNQTLAQYIAFAYRLTSSQQSDLMAAAPAWVSQDRFNLQARTDKTDVTKDELRLMVRQLLAERFALAVHYETRVASVFGLQLVKPGGPGPRLRPHQGGDCSRALPVAAHSIMMSPPESIDGGFPATCGGLLMMPPAKPTHFHIGARDVPISLIANALPSWGDLSRPVVDQTGLAGHYDFALDFVPKQPDPKPGDLMPAEQEEPDFLDALRKQLGLKLESQKQPVEVLVLDHIERLSDD